MKRLEFSKSTKRQAFERASGKCEGFGLVYGLPEGKRCNMPLVNGCDYDHVILAANGGDNSLGNAACVCRSCHKWKSSHHDIPLAAKTQRQQDKARNIKKRSIMPGSRRSKWKMNFDGTVTRR